MSCIEAVAAGVPALVHLRTAVVPLLGDGWTDLPGFVFFFGTIFAAAVPFWFLVVGLPWKKATLLSSCTMSAVHGILSASAAWGELSRWQRFELDLPNSPAQALLCQYSLAYMVADMLFYLLPFTPGDYLYIVHHFITGVYIVGTLLTGRGGISFILMAFVGEVTSPILNTFSISRELRHRSKAAARVFRFASPAFTITYVLVRSVLAPPLVVWFLYSFWFRTHGIPLAWRVPMGSCVALGILASQAWTLKLVKGFLRQHQRAKAAAGKQV